MTKLRLLALMAVVSFAALCVKAEGSKLDVLWSEVQKDPNNVDAALRLAIYLARKDESLLEAEKLARMVTAKAPTYLDAYLLLARIESRKKLYAKALLYVRTVLSRDPNHMEAKLLRIDILMWSENWKAAENELKELLLRYPKDPTLIVKQLQIDLARRRLLRVIQHAEPAPNDERVRTIIQDIDIVTLYTNHEFEYYGFPSEAAKKDRFGYGLNLAGRVFRGARISVALLESVRYRFQTINNQVGLELNLKPMRFWDVTLRAIVGAPAKVIPMGSFFFGLRTELWKHMDASLSYALDLLAWPANRPALLHRPSLTVGAYIDEHLNLSAGYTMGLLRFCGRDPIMIHSGNVSIGLQNEKVGAQWFYGFGQEVDPYILGAVSISSCDMVAAAEESAQAGLGGFRLVELRIHTAGASLSWKLNRRFSISVGYRFELRMLEDAVQIILAHITNLSLVMNF